MKKKYLETKTVIIVFFLTTASIISILIIYNLINKISDEKNAGFFFDISIAFITSIFSAFIAYVVALIQVRAESNKIRKKEDAENIRNINLLLIEMKNNIEVIDVSLGVLSENPDSNIDDTQFSTEIFKMIINKINVPNELMADLLRETRKKELVFCNKKISIEELKEYKENYEKVYSNFQKEINKN